MVCLLSNLLPNCLSISGLRHTACEVSVFLCLPSHSVMDKGARTSTRHGSDRACVSGCPCSGSWLQPARSDRHQTLPTAVYVPWHAKEGEEMCAGDSCLEHIVPHVVHVWQKRRSQERRTVGPRKPPFSSVGPFCCQPNLFLGVVASPVFLLWALSLKFLWVVCCEPCVWPESA